MPHPLLDASPALSSATCRIVGNARAALAALDSTARRLPNPQVSSATDPPGRDTEHIALEGTYAPLAQVLTADEDRPQSLEEREVLNYVSMADAAFDAIEQGRSLPVGMLDELQGILVAGTPHASPRDLSISYGRANKLVAQLSPVFAEANTRRFFALAVLEVLVTEEGEQPVDHR